MSDPQPLEYASPDTPASPPKGALRTVFFIVFLDLLGFGVIIPLLPFYIPDYQEHSMQVGLLFSIYSICQFIGAPILGALSDRFGRRPILIISQIGSAAGYALLGWVSMHDQWRTAPIGLGLIYLSRVIDGFSGGNISTAQAYVSDVTTPENRARGMGVLGAAFGIGFSAGPALGGLMGQLHLALPAFVAAGLSLLAALATWKYLPESRVHKPSAEAQLWLHPSRLKLILQRPALTQLMLIGFFSMAAFVMMETSMAMYLSRTDTFEFSKAKVGLFFALAGVTIAVVQGGLIGRLTKRFGEWPLAALGPAFVALGMGLFVTTAYAPLIWILLLGCIVNAGGRSLQHPTLSSLVSKYSDPREQGVVFGMYHGLSSLARVIGPLVAGAVYARHMTAPFLVAGAIVVVASLWTVILRASTLRNPVAV